jgi:hypothetical protein
MSNGLETAAKRWGGRGHCGGGGSRIGIEAAADILVNKGNNDAGTQLSTTVHGWQMTIFG